MEDGFERLLREVRKCDLSACQLNLIDIQRERDGGLFLLRSYLSGNRLGLGFFWDEGFQGDRPGLRPPYIQLGLLDGNLCEVDDLGNRLGRSNGDRYQGKPYYGIVLQIINPKCLEGNVSCDR